MINQSRTLSTKVWLESEQELERESPERNDVETEEEFDRKGIIGKVLNHRDPTYEAVLRRFIWNEADWTIIGPKFSDGTKPVIHIEERLVQLLLNFLGKNGSLELSRPQRRRVDKGLSVTRVRIRKKITPAASVAKQKRYEGSDTKNQSFTKGL